MSLDRCERCGHSRHEWAQRCENCRTEFWCPWDPDWYKGRLTRISIGQDELARKFGVLFAVVGAVALAYGMVLQVFYAEAESRDIAPLFAMLFGGYATYEVWAYFHGHATSVDHVVHEPRPENTLWRTFGLLGDIAFFILACVILYDIR